MRYLGAPLVLLLLCAGCFPKKSPVGSWTTTLWDLPVQIDFHEGKVAGKLNFRDAPVKFTGSYTFENEMDFSFTIDSLKLKHGNPFTEQMLQQEVDVQTRQRTYKGSLKFENPGEMDLVIESQPKDIHMLFKKASPSNP